MTHVTLIRPPLMFPKFRPSESVNVIPPLGLAYLAGSLRAAGYAVSCIDSPGEALRRYRESSLDERLVEQGLRMEEIFDRIPSKTVVIGISCMFSYEWFYMIELIRGIRARFPSAFIVLGGEHSTADHEYILKSMHEVDACVLGEGEAKMLGLVQALSNGVAKQELPGVAVFDPASQSVRKNAETDGHYRIQDVDGIPRPAWDLLPLRQYLELGHGGGGRRAIPMLASRGCPHRCTFCSSPNMWTTRFKSRDVDDLIDEIKTYVREYGINRVEFYDLTLVIDKRWVLEFCRKLIDENLGLTWAMPTGTRTEGLTEEVLALVKESGCIKLTYPLETGSRKTCVMIKKNINYDRSLSSMRNAVRAGVIVKSNLIIGFPFQTLRDIFVEYLFAIRLAWIGASDIAFFNFVPYPGSELHNQLVAEGTIVKDAAYPEWLRKVFPANFTDCMSWCPGISGGALRILCLVGIGQFYAFQFLFRPQRLVALARRVWAGAPLTVLEIWLVGAGRRLKRRRESRLLGEQRGSAA